MSTDSEISRWVQNIPSDVESMVSDSHPDSNADNRQIGAEMLISYDMAESDHSDDLIVFGDSVENDSAEQTVTLQLSQISQIRPDFARFRKEANLLDGLGTNANDNKEPEENLMTEFSESLRTGISPSDDLIDFGDDEPPAFGVLKNTDKDFHFTMRQKARSRRIQKTVSLQKDSSTTSSRSRQQRLERTEPTSQINQVVKWTPNTDDAPPSEELETLYANVFSVAIPLQMAVGEVSLELNFGRIYTQVHEGMITMGDGPRYEVSAATQSLANHAASQIGFSPVLTISGDDAAKLVNIPAPGQTPWKRSGSRHLYVFECQLFDNQNPSNPTFRVQVDVLNNNWRCRSMPIVVSTVYIHCAKQAWDMRVQGTRADILDKDERHALFARNLVSALRVT